MNQLHFGVKQLKIGKTRGVLDSFVYNHVNMLTWRVFTETVTYVNFSSLYESLLATWLFDYLNVQ